MQDIEELQFTAREYNEYLKKRSVVQNTKLRAEQDSFVDAMLSPEADWTKAPDAELIISTIKDME